MRQFDMNGPHGSGRVEVDKQGNALKKQGLLTKLLMRGTVGQAAEKQTQRREEVDAQLTGN